MKRVWGAWVCLGALGATGAASAAPSATFDGEVDYVVPVTTPALEPFARFFVPRFRVFTDDEGKFHIILPVPRDLTAGKPIEVELVETDREGTSIRFDRDLGTATCDVPADWATSQCRYVFNDNFREQVPVPDARGYLSRKYAGDSTLAVRTQVVVGEFLESTESVGVAKFGALGSGCRECVLGNGLWNSTYSTANGQSVKAELSLERRAGHYFNSSGSGQLSNIVYNGNVASGKWSYGTSTGWFRFVFSTPDAFSGTWGLGAPGSAQAGVWKGTRM